MCCTFKSGVNFETSSIQFYTSDVGQTTRDFCFRSLLLYIFCNKVNVCNVFPSHMSSANIHEKLYFSKKLTQLYHVCW